MKKATRIPAVLRACVIGAVMLALYQPTIAQEAGKDVSGEIRGLRNSTISADVYTIPVKWTFRTQLYEQKVMTMGCHYIASEKNDLDDLFAVLERAQLTQQPESKYGFDAHTVIHLHTSGGEQVALVLSPEYTNAPAFGMFKGNTPVVTKMGFGTDLLNWKKQRKPEQPNLLMCKDE